MEELMIHNRVDENYANCKDWYQYSINGTLL